VTLPGDFTDMKSFQHFLFTFLLFVSPFIQASPHSEKALEEKSWTKSALKEIWSLESKIKTALVAYRENREDIELFLERYESKRSSKPDCTELLKLIDSRERMGVIFDQHFHDTRTLLRSLTTSPDTPENLQREVQWDLMVKMQEEYVNHYINHQKVQEILGKCPSVDNPYKRS
jgi:hypothetical protein